LKEPVAVNIAGQRYVVRSEADETYVRTLASYLDEQIDELKRNSKVVATQKLAILAALNIADELFRERRKRSELESRVRQKSRSLLAFLDGQLAKWSRKNTTK